jgi:hypothetical protein
MAKSNTDLQAEALSSQKKALAKLVRERGRAFKHESAVRGLMEAGTWGQGLLDEVQRQGALLVRCAVSAFFACRAW